jgi:hypothetical protein
MGAPLPIVFADGTCRCARCKGLGLVRGVGARAGEHYVTLNGAQAALAAGRAVDCPVCKGFGIDGLTEAE